jgi:hypothetical protein
VREIRALTPDELSRAERRLLNPAPGTRTAAAKDFGIDLTLLLDQLRLTPAERARQMLELCQEVELVRGRALRNTQ